MPEEGSRAMQYFSALAVTLTMVFQGVILAWPSPVLPKLLNGQTELTINKEQCSWMISLIMAGGIPGCIASQYLSDIIGRKKTILATAIPCILGSVMILLATVPWVLYIARTICGFGGGMIVVVVSIYIAEIADKEIRGALGTLLQSMANMGNLLMYTVGPFVSYTTLNGIVLAIPLVCLAFCIWIPESPYYYLKEGNVAGAEKVIKKLKGLQDIKPLESELMNLKAQIKKDMERKTTVTELLTKKEYRKAVLVVAGLKALQQMTGAIVIQSYLETIFRQTSMNITGQVASIVYGVVQIFAGFVATFLVDKAGRKPLLFLSSLGTGVALTLVGIYFFMQDYLKLDDEIMSTISLLPIVGIVGFNILYVIGIGNLPYVMQAELFPTNVKSAASSVATMAGAFLAFVVTKTYQGLADTAGIYTVFWMFASISYAGVFFVFFFVPETKGKSLLGIQEKLQRQRKIPKENNNLPEAIPLQSA